MKKLISMLAVAAIFAVSNIALAQAKTVRYSKSAPSGKTQWIDAYFGWNSDCSFKTIKVDVVQKPKFGRVSPRVNTQRIRRAQAGRAGKCIGRKTKAVSVYYKSKRGYRGRDSFKIRMKVRGQRPVFFVYRMRVR